MKSLDRRLRALERRDQADDGPALSPFDAAWLDKFGWLPRGYCYHYAACALGGELPDDCDGCTCERTTNPKAVGPRVFTYDLKGDA